MKLKDTVWLILLVVVLLSGCHKKVVYLVAPDQVEAVAYADTGGTITWKPDHDPGQPGQPFQVQVAKNKNGKIPCLGGDDNLISDDGKKSVVCHLDPSVKAGGNYRFTVVPYPPPTTANKAGGKDPVVIMHVGPCTGCSAPGTPKTPGSPGKSGTSGTSVSPSTTHTTQGTPPSRPFVGLYCDDNNNNSLADPPDLTVDKDAEVHWWFEAGTGPPAGTVPFTVTLDPGVCSNNPDGTKNTTITTNKDFCKVSTSGKYTYQFTVYSCNPSPVGSATITLP